MIVLVMLTTVLAPYVEPPFIFGPGSPEFTNYVACLSKEADSLEPSNAVTDEIFDAAVTACDDEWDRAFHAIEDKISRHNATDSGTRTLAIMREMVPNWRANQRLAILRKRAKRKGGNRWQ